MRWIYFLLIMVFFWSCTATRKLDAPERRSSLGGTEFYRQAAGMGWRARDSFAVKEILNGNMPSFLLKFEPVEVAFFDSSSQKTIRATFYVSPDYISIGTDDDWARIPLTPMASQIIADSLGCFLPTRKLVNDIYGASKIKLEPIPMFAYRDSTPTMWHHHLMIEGQRKQRNGFISGIKKDIVITSRLNEESKKDRVAIYGWHKPDGKPIQQLYTGHVNWYVDYSHGTRLVYERVKVDGGWMDYRELLNDIVLKKLLCDEEDCRLFRYSGKE